MKRYSANPNVLRVEIDHPIEAAWLPPGPWTPNDPGLVHQYHLINANDADIDADQAWGYVRGDPSVKIAVLDTGIDAEHPDLAGKVVLARSFLPEPTDPTDQNGHGTHVAGIAAANTDNGRGVAGVCPNCALINGRVLNESGKGKDSYLIAAIYWAVENGASIINMSLTGKESSGFLEDALQEAHAHGVVLVGAAGNEATTVPRYPAAYPQVIAVAATDSNDDIAYFSNRNSSTDEIVDWVDIAAPGHDILSTYCEPAEPTLSCQHIYAWDSGTSMAAPVVAGVAGLARSMYWWESAQEIRNRIESTADPIAGTGEYWTYGRVNAYNAVKITYNYDVFLPQVAR